MKNDEAVSVRAIFHLGTFKTGSTTLQHTLAANTEALDKSGILYPLAGRRFRGRSDHRHIGLSHYPDGSPRQQKAIASVIAEMKATHHATAILSSESWCNPDAEDRLETFVNELAAADMTATGVVFLRNRYKYARSHYREWTQNWRNTQVFEKYVKRKRGHWDYLELATRLNRIFNGQVTFVNFERVTDTVAAFERLLDLPGLNRTAPQNPSLNAIETEIVRQFHAQQLEPPHLDRLRADVVPSLGTMPDRSSYSERLDHPALQTTQTYRDDLRRATRLGAEDIDDLCQLPEQSGSDISAIRPLCEAAVAAFDPND